MEKTRLGIIFGGKSSEHEVSVVSAKSVIEGVNREKYEVIIIGIDRDGTWLEYNGRVEDMEVDRWQENSCPVQLSELSEMIDFAFPVLHGLYGEDGCIQGMFEILNIPYAGCGVLSSSLCMDKVAAKALFVKYGIPTCAYTEVTKERFEREPEKVLDEVTEELNGTVFVKPANLGSSVGISKAETREELKAALEKAVIYDRRILIEEAVDGREVETGVIGNDHLEIGEPGEIILPSEFYDYESKYSDDAGTELLIPAPVSEDKKKELEELAFKAYRAMDCAGFARLDFFIERETERVLINEINTIPGFTSHSMFPVMFAKKGVPMDELIDRIVEAGYERYNDKNNRETVYGRG